jgi:hypothetical protein
MSRAVRVCLLALFGCFLASPALLADTIQDSANASASSCLCSWGATDVGWMYTPSSSYDLTGVLTLFSSYGASGNSVTEVIYSGLPSSGGTLLASATFTAQSGVFSGGSFAPLSLLAGQTYFVGFENVGNLGANVTQDSGAVSLGTLYFDGSNSMAFNILENGYFTSQPILEFSGTSSSVPEPSSLLLLAVGLIALAAHVLRRQ